MIRLLPLLLCCLLSAGEAVPTILICRDPAAPAAVLAAAEAIAREPDAVPALRVLREAKLAAGAELIDSAALLAPKAFERAARNHLVVIGLPGDPLRDRVWGRMSALSSDPPRLYAQGWGELLGDLGAVRADRNPFLHSPQIRTPGRATILLALSGTTVDGLVAAATAMRGGLLDGIVPGSAWRRGSSTVLDLDPRAEPCPLTLPGRLPDGRAWAGWHQCGADEFRAHLDLGGVEPQAMWRAKWLDAKPLASLAERSWPAWHASFHRKAYGNAASLMRFADPAQARAAAEAIGRGWRDDGDGVKSAEQPADEVARGSADGEVRVVAVGTWVILASLDKAAFAAVRAAAR